MGGSHRVKPTHAVNRMTERWIQGCADESSVFCAPSAWPLLALLADAAEGPGRRELEDAVALPAADARAAALQVLNLLRGTSRRLGPAAHRWPHPGDAGWGVPGNTGAPGRRDVRPDPLGTAVHRYGLADHVRHRPVEGRPLLPAEPGHAGPGPRQRRTDELRRGHLLGGRRDERRDRVPGHRRRGTSSLDPSCSAWTL